MTALLKPWIQPDPIRPRIRFVAQRVANGESRMLVLGQDVMTPAEHARLADIGFERSSDGRFYSRREQYHTLNGQAGTGMTLGMAEVRHVFPTAIRIDVPAQVLNNLAFVRAIAGPEEREEVRDVFNTVMAERRLGMNADGETVWEGVFGRWVTATQDNGRTRRVSFNSIDGRPERWLKGRGESSLQQVADGFVAEMAAGRHFSWNDLVAFAATVTEMPEAEVVRSPRMREVQEAVEAAMVRRVHGTVRSVADPAALGDAYGMAQALEERQPPFRARTSDSVIHQQYSTPLALSLAVQHVLGDLTGRSLLEPTIGNGSLVASVADAQVTGCEIDPARAATVRRDRPDIALIEGDAQSVAWAPAGGGRFDAVVANPPFGGLETPVMHGELKVRRLDHLILLRALESRSDEGVGVFIIGADSAIDSRAGKVSGSSRHLFNWLEERYDTRVVEIDGAVYAKQGAAFPLRLVVVGRREPGSAVPDELPVLADHEAILNWVKAVRHERDLQQAEAEAVLDVDGLVLPGLEGNAGPVPPDAVSGDAVFEASLVPEATAAAPRALADENAFQSPYQAMSLIGESSAMVPRNLATPIRLALEEIAAREGDIDAFVARSLGWTVAEMRDKQYLSPEQVDAVALAIDAVTYKMRAALEGDMTGLGKGRVMAAMARFAALNQRPTVFLTETATLFTDFWRDIRDIGSADLFKPLILNDGVAVYDPLSQATLVPPTPKAVVKQALGADGLPTGYNLLLSTYSQFNRAPAVSPKARWLAGVAQGSMLLLDESHNAAGESNTARNVDGALEAAEWVTYSSATSMKGAANVVIYRKLFPDTVDVGRLPETLRAGGEVLQEVLSGMMARDGVFIRREHDLSDLRFSVIEDPAQAEENRAAADALARILELMNYLSGDINALVSERNKEIQGLLDSLPESERAGSRMGAISVNFGSRLFAIYRQFLMSIKTDLAADQAVKALREGAKPVITMENTMESLLKDLVSARAMGEGYDGASDEEDAADATLGRQLGQGGLLLDRPISFREVLHRMLDRLRYYQESDRYGERQRVEVQSKEFLEAVANVAYLIDEFPDLPASPLDVIRSRIAAAGYVCDELSGRKLKVLIADDGSHRAVMQRERPKAHIVAACNAGDTDGLMLTLAGSTGISLHASSTFADQRQRVLIELQSPGDVNKRVQFFGRVNRKGQVSAPEVITLISGLIGESRPIAMQNAKLRKLSANTTANQDSAALDRSVPDIINGIGNQVAQRFLEANPDIARRLDIDYDPEKVDARNDEDTTFINKLLSRCVMLSSAEQEQLYSEILSEYTIIISELDAKGINPFKSTELDIRCREIRADVYEAGDASSPSVFNHPVMVKTICYEEVLTPLRSADVERLTAMSRQRFVSAYGASTAEVCDHFAAAVARRTARLLEAARGSQAKQTVEEMLAEPQDNAVRRMDRRMRWLQGFLRGVDLGAVIAYTGPEGDAVKGVVVDVRLAREERKEHNLGEYEVILVSPGGSHTISKTAYALFEDTAYAMAQSRQARYDGERRALLDAVDRAPAGQVTRHRLVLDGNLFRAAEIAATNKLGASAIYTDHEGRRLRGILLRRGVEMEDLASLPISVTSPALGARMLAEVPGLRLASWPGGVATGRDRNDDLYGVRLMADGAQMLLSVPGTKASGGRFFQSEELMAITGRFSGTRDGMSASFPRSETERVLHQLRRMGVSLMAGAEHRDRIRQWAGDSASLDVEYDNASCSRRPEPVASGV